MKPRCWTSDSCCKFALQQRLEGLEGPSTSHCAPAQLLLPGRAGGEQLESRFWPTVRRWWAEPKERRGRAPGVGGALPAFTRRRLVCGRWMRGSCFLSLGGVQMGLPLPRTQVVGRNTGALCRGNRGQKGPRSA